MSNSTRQTPAGKSSPLKAPIGRRRGHALSRRRLRIISLAVLQCFSAAPAVFAATVLPTNGQVAAGSATISQPNAQTLQISQGSQSAILNWETFSISADGTVNFLQPGASSVALNRVLGGSPSEIFGRLTANGQIFLVNPSGVLFGRGASVDVGGLAASTLDIKDGDFLAGRYVFAREGAAGSVVNQGTINAPGGYAALIGPNVANEGLISARMGSVALAAGDRVTLDMIGDGLIRVEVDQAALGAAAINRGTLAADGGSVIMTARSADALLDTVVNNEGVIRANSLVERNGSIYLDGGSSGVTSVSGTLDASGREAGLTGGTVTVLGDKVGLFDNARIDVSGDAGGGTALIGGNFQGQGPERNASAVFMGSDVLITADALSRGNGGTVVLWSDGFTSAHGTIYARGGAQSGDGGQIETSGHQILDATGVRGGAGASNGGGGLWLFDPDSDVAITAGGNANGAFVGGTWTPTLNNSNIQNTSLNAVLDGGTNVTVTTTNLLLGTQAGNITVSAPITNTSGGGRMLTLNAGSGGGAGSVAVNSSISGTGANSLAVNLNAGTGGGVSFGAGGSITTLGGNIAITSSTGGVSQTAGSTLNSGAGTILVNGGAGAINMSGALTTTNATAGAVTIQNATTAALGNITANSGTVTLGVSGNNSGAVTQNATTAISASTLTANTGNSINLGNANTITNLGAVLTNGAFTLNDMTGGLTLTGLMSTTGNPVSITTAGGALALGTNNITGNQVSLQGAGVTQAAGSTVNAGAGTILVNGGGGAINLVGTLTTNNATASAVTIQNATSAALGNITATSGGVVLGVSSDITGALTQTSGTTISTGSLAVSTANSIALTNAGNDFTGTVSLNNSGANSVAVTDANAIVLGTSNVGSGTLTVTATGASSITQTGAITQAPGAGAASFTTGAGAITLTQANEFTGAVSLANTGPNAIQVTGSTAITLGAVNTASNLAVNAVGITQNSGVLTVGGTSSFNAGAGQITLTTATNDFTGAVSLSNSGANNVAVTDANAIMLGTSSVGSGTLTVTATGANSITQTGAITQAAAAGAASFTTGAGVITLTQANDFTGAVSLNNSGANNAAVTDASAIVLGTSSVGQNLAVTASGNITQNGALTVPGTSTFTMNAINEDVLLGSAANNLVGTLTITGTVRDVALRNTNALAAYPSLPSGLRNLTVQFDNAAMVLPTTLLSGNLAVTTGGVITQSGALTVPGTSSFNAGANAITLTTATNDFTGAVSLNNSGANNVAVTDANAIVLGASNVGSGTLTVTATGANSITQTGAITQAAAAGAANFAAGAGAITLTQANDFTGAVSLSNSGANNVAVTDANALILAAGTFGGNLDVVANGAVTQTGALAVTGTTSVDAGAGPITLTTATNNFTGAVSLSNSGANNVAVTDANALILAAGMFGGNLDVVANGAVTQTGALAVTGTTSVNAGAGPITLTAAANNFTGAVSLANTGANAIQVTDVNAIVLGTVSTAGNLTVNAVGITQNTGGLAVGGTSSFNAGAGVITLTTATNDFTGAVSLSNSGANNVAVTDANALILAAGTFGGNLDVVANGAVTQTGALAVTGTTSVDAGAGPITLTTATNDFTGAVSLSNSGANAIQVTDVNAIVLDTVSTANNLTVNAVGITQNAGLTVGGTSSFNAGAGQITLTAPTNDFAGLVSLANTGANAIQVSDSNAILLGTVNTANNLTVNAVGIAQNASVLTVGGSSSFSAGAGAITLTQANDFAGAVSLNNSGANNVAVTDQNAIVLGTSTVGQNLAVTAGGNITQSGALTVPGASTFTMNAISQDVLLGSAANNLAGTVTITNGTGTVRDVELRNTNALAVYPSLPVGLRNLSLQFDNAAMVLAATGLGGDLAMTAAGAITQSGALSVAGSSSFNAGANAIMLTNGGNDFAGAVSLSNSGANNVAVIDANAIQLGTSNVGSGTLTVTATGANGITQTGAITQAAAAGAATFTTGAGAITLTQANDFTGAVSLSNSGPNNVAVTDVSAIQLGASSVGQNLAVAAGGNITQSGALTVSGTSTFTINTAANQDVLLGSAANNLGGAVTIANGTGTVRDVALRNTNAAAVYPSLPGGLRNLSLQFDNAPMVLAATGLSGNLAVTAGGAITQSGALTVPGTSSFNAGAGQITLTTATNDFAGAVSLSNSGANNVAVADANAIQLGISSVGQNLAVAAGGHITQSGALTVPGTSTFTINGAANQDVLLADAANNLAGAVTITGGTGGTIRDVELRNTNAAAAYPSLPGGLRNLTLELDNAGVVLPTTLLSGDLAVTAGGAITQSGALSVAGTSSFGAGANAITLTTATNDFQSAVTLAGGTTAITDANALTFGTLSTGDLAAISTGTLNLGSGTVGGMLTATSNNNAITTGSLSVTGNGGATVNAGTSAVTVGPSFVVSGPLAITASTLTGAGKASSTLGSGAVTLTLADVLGGSSGAELFNTNVTGSLTVSGPDGNYFFAGNPPGGGVSVSSPGIHVFFNGIEITTSLATLQVAAARTSVSMSVLTAVVEETKKSFGTDSVAEQIDYGFAGDVGVSAAMDHRIEGYGISVPRCFVESQRNIPCE